MTTKKISDVKTFKRKADEARNLPISKEDIDRINEISREVEREENQVEETDLPKIAKQSDDSISAQQ